jgi:hypothetical protein
MLKWNHPGFRQPARKESVNCINRWENLQISGKKGRPAYTMKISIKGNKIPLWSCLEYVPTSALTNAQWTIWRKKIF